MGQLRFRTRLVMITTLICSVFVFVLIYSRTYFFYSNLNIELIHYGGLKNFVTFIQPNISPQKKYVSFIISPNFDSENETSTSISTTVSTSTSSTSTTSTSTSEPLSLICPICDQGADLLDSIKSNGSIVQGVNVSSLEYGMINNIETDVKDKHDWGSIKSLPFHNGRLDSRRIIKIYDWVWAGEKWDELQESYQVCLSTQGSMDRIHWIPEVVENWAGPISLAVFIVSPEEWIGLNILVNYFKKCSPLFKNYVSIHVALPVKIEHWTMDWSALQLDETETKSFYKTINNYTCSSKHSKAFVEEVVNRFKPSKANEKLMNSYPQNHMRNIARKACGIGWVLSSDIDIIPRPGSADSLQTFVTSMAAKHCKKCAFVIPTFELDKTHQYPQTKAEMVKKWRKSHVARPFHFGVFQPAHNATNYHKWCNQHLKDGPIKISHNADKKYFQYYEPFYISPITIPEFQERFIGYGFTRNSQVKEAVVEGWQFKVLTPIFGIHWGLQNPLTLINPGNERILRRKQTFYNKRIYKRFLKELTLRTKLKKEEAKEKKEKLPDFSKF